MQSYLSLLLHCHLCLLPQCSLKYNILYMPCFFLSFSPKVSHVRDRTVQVQRGGWEAFVKLWVLRWWEISKSLHLKASFRQTFLPTFFSLSFPEHLEGFQSLKQTFIWYYFFYLVLYLVLVSQGYGDFCDCFVFQVKVPVKKLLNIWLQKLPWNFCR